MCRGNTCSGAHSQGHSRWSRTRPRNITRQEEQPELAFQLSAITLIADAAKEAKDRLRREFAAALEEVGADVYEGMVIGENSRPEDMDVNIVREKKLTNMRASGSDENEKLIPPKILNLEQALEYCREDECVEVTPTSVRIRKVIFDQNERSRLTSKAKKANQEG